MTELYTLYDATVYGVDFRELPKDHYGVPSALELFGKKVRELRLERRLSQEKLSDMCAVHRNFIGRVERAQTNIQFDRIMKIAGGLKVRPEILFEYVPKPKPPEPLDEK